MNRADPWSPSAQSWLTQVDEAPGGILVFSIRHEHGNAYAVAQVSQWRCTVREPAGDGTVWTAETQPGVTSDWVFLQWPGHFTAPAGQPAATPLDGGRLLFRWQGMDQHGNWHDLAYGDWQRPDAAPAPAPAEVARRPRSWRPTPQRWRMLGKRP